jgi:hypothetical protein
MKDTTKNKAPIAPTSAAPSNAAGSKPRVAPVVKGTLVKKKGAQAADPTIMAKPSRKNVMNPEAGNAGARYGIRVKFQQTVAPEATSTQANGRILPAAIRRQAPNFATGMADHN